MNEPNAEAHQGKIVEWHDDKGYGFADDGSQRVFIHRRAFTRRPGALAVGDTVSYTIGTDDKDRPCGRHLVLLERRAGLHMIHLVMVAVLLAAPTLAVWRRIDPAVAQGIAAWGLLMSVLTFSLYAWDKRRAVRGGTRLSETALHCWEALGGWPGALLAQRRVRHKSSKISYQAVFWFIVGVYQYVAIDWLLHWRMLGQLRAWLGF